MREVRPFLLYFYMPLLISRPPRTADDVHEGQREARAGAAQEGGEGGAREGEEGGGGQGGEADGEEAQLPHHSDRDLLAFRREQDQECVTTLSLSLLPPLPLHRRREADGPLLVQQAKRRIRPTPPAKLPKPSRLNRVPPSPGPSRRRTPSATLRNSISKLVRFSLSSRFSNPNLTYSNPYRQRGARCTACEEERSSCCRCGKSEGCRV